MNYINILDKLGTILGIIGYLFIVNAVWYGFLIGVVASLMLVIVGINKKLFSLWGLQGFLVCANIYATLTF